MSRERAARAPVTAARCARDHEREQAASAHRSLTSGRPSRPRATTAASTSARPLLIAADLVSLTKPRITRWWSSRCSAACGSRAVTFAPAGRRAAVDARRCLDRSRWRCSGRSSSCPAPTRSTCTSSATSTAAWRGRRTARFPRGAWRRRSRSGSASRSRRIAIPLLSFGVNAITGAARRARAAQLRARLHPAQAHDDALAPDRRDPRRHPAAARVDGGHRAASMRPGFAALRLSSFSGRSRISSRSRSSVRTTTGARGSRCCPVERGDRATRHHIVGYLVALVRPTLLLVPLGVAGPVLPRRRDRCSARSSSGSASAASAPGTGAPWARRVFFASIVYLVLLFAALMIGA